MASKSAYLRLKPGSRPRVLQGHPWVFANEVCELFPSEFDGLGVTLKDFRGRALGSGIYNRTSQIVWRRFSKTPDKPFDKSFLKDAIEQAIGKRKEEPFRRIVWSEADHLPGLVIDQYDRNLVVQFLTKAVDMRQSEIAEVLEEQLAPEEVIFRNDAPARKYEGLEREVRTLSSNSFQPRWFKIEGMEYFLDLEKGNKTGFYMDQRRQHLSVASFAKGRRVLDGFCNQGAFALHCAAAGAASTVGIDISESAITVAGQNAEKNGLEIVFRSENLFDFFTSNRGLTFDLIVLDPPSFARNRSSVRGALRGYKELNLRAMAMLTKGGILATYSCSRHVTRPVFMGMLNEAAADANVEVTLLRRMGQPADHPVLLNLPESEYLKGALLKVN